ncbi:probable sulfate transporter 3.5 [Durio zibethinus]|uniref:Probable sulfate transporter 3.5 n=1 Tax=Durio zibethinus TaxID=66656 RepID=A0A6P5XT49_DURZI|nr:probable sulfate transporter 3.5 [Durio zibethinus]
MTSPSHTVNFSAPRGFITAFKSDCKETFFPDDPFHKSKDKPLLKLKKKIQYFVPLFEWLPKYNLHLLRYDLLAGITITSLAIPQGISYAKLGDIPPINGLYSSFIPPFVYAIFGSSKHLAVGTVAACSLLISDTIGAKVSPKDDPTLYLHLVFTATFFTGIFQTALGFLRLGILVDFLSHSTITGFMGGTAIIICLQQLKGIFGLKHFTTHTDVVSVLRAVFSHRYEWRWQSAVVGVVFLAFLQFTRFLRQKKPKLFWVSAMAPMVVVVVGCLFVFFAHADKYGIQIVGDLKKGLNPPSIQYLNFDRRYLPVTVQAGLVTGLVALAEGIAIGRSFAILKNEQTDGNKEMIAFGFMNVIGSFTSCYLTTGPFSKTAVNFNAGCRTAMSNIVMGFCMMLTLLFLAPLFSYTPLVALSSIIMSAMLGLINYEEMLHLFKVDKFDFVICMAAFLGVSFISMDVGLILSVGLALLRALLYVARPAACKLGKIPNSTLYRDTEQYPGSTPMQGILVLQLGSPIYFANSTYIRERILRYIQKEQGISDSKSDVIEHLLLDLSGVSSIDMTGIETFVELRRILDAKGIKLAIVNPRIEVLEKMTLAKFTDAIGKESFYLSIEDAIQSARFSLDNKATEESSNDQNVA